MKKQNKKGVSLLELILVLGVGTTVTFMKFQDMKNEQETVVAKAVGEQINSLSVSLVNVEVSPFLVGKYLTGAKQVFR